MAMLSTRLLVCTSGSACDLPSAHIFQFFCSSITTLYCALLFASPGPLLASSATVSLETLFSSLMVTSLLSDVGAGLALLADATQLVVLWACQPTLPPEYVPKRLRGSSWLRRVIAATHRLHTLVWPPLLSTDTPPVITKRHLRSARSSVFDRPRHPAKSLSPLSTGSLAPSANHLRAMEVQHDALTASLSIDERPTVDASFRSSIDERPTVDAPTKSSIDERPTVDAPTILLTSIDEMADSEHPTECSTTVFPQVEKEYQRANELQIQLESTATATTNSWFPTFASLFRFITLSSIFCSLQASTTAVNDHRYDSDSFLIAVDNCSSRCITNSLQDYVQPPEKVNVRVKGIGGSVTATYKGTVKWSAEDEDGRVHTWYIPDTYYNEFTPYRLLSPQHWAQTQRNGRGTWAATFHDSVELFWKDNKFKRVIPLDPGSNIALLRSAPSFGKLHSFCAEIAGEMDIDETELMCMPVAMTMPNDDDPATVTDEESVATSDSEQDDFFDGQERPSPRRHPDLPDEAFDEPARAQAFQDEVTAAFECGKELSTIELTKIVEEDEVRFSNPQAELLSWHYRLAHLPFGRIQKMAERGDLPSYLKDAKVPRCASCLFGKATRRPWRTKAPVNQQVIPPATAPGAVVGVDQLISTTAGFVGQMRGLLTRRRYTVSTVFVDHFSGFSYVHLQLSTDAEHTLEAKRAFERLAKVYGVTVRHYHADNHIFDSKLFVDEVHRAKQTISYCGVNAHHQNGKAEKKIRDLQELARTMILHAKQRWPSAITVNLWPYALRMANEVSNVSPILDGRDHVSPVELFSQVQVKPEVKFTHTFGSPVYVLDAKLQAGKPKPKWEHRARVGIYLGPSPRHSRKVALVLNLSTGHVSPQFHCLFDDSCDTLRPSSGNPLPLSEWQDRAGFTGKERHSAAPRDNTAAASDARDPPDSNQGETAIIPGELQQREPILGDHEDDQSTLSHPGLEHDPAPPPVEPPPNPVTTTRSGRTVRRPTRFIEEIESYFVPWEVFHDGGFAIQDDLVDPIAFAASNNPDILYLNEAMAAPDREEFRKAMHKEVASHVENQHWELLHRSQIPKDAEVLPAVWAFKRKRRIATQEVYKWKARLNLHGGRQTKDVNYWETYSPVVGWATIRMFLILMLINGWNSRQVDFVLAFPQADIECEMFMEVPQGFNVNGNRSDYCLRLQKNLYGQKQAGRVWNQYLHDGLLARGFQQSDVDMCVYYRKSVVLLLYVDDGIFIGPKQTDIDEAYNLLVNEFTDSNGVRYRAYNMTNEGDLADYLGVKITRLGNGLIKLSQPHMIQQILDDLGMGDNTKAQPTPAVPSVKLNRDLHGKPFSEEWHYRSVIGKLNFLEKSTRADLAYAVHQCARFAIDPKESHAAAVKRIGRYLAGTKDKGIILNPRSHSFECFVDADFVGNWDRVNANVDPSTAKSRTGYVLLYGGCPMVWASKLQREVALSTTEAEYNALSESLREVINLMQLLDETKVKLKWDTASNPPTVHCKVFEDNSGALEMGKLPKMRPRTKHICVRMHHFREAVREGKVSLHKIPSRYQLADIATKPQPVNLFEEQRESLLQWKAEHATVEELRAAPPADHLRACGSQHDSTVATEASGHSQASGQTISSVRNPVRNPV